MLSLFDDNDKSYEFGSWVGYYVCIKLFRRLDGQNKRFIRIYTELGIRFDLVPAVELTSVRKTNYMCNAHTNNSNYYYYSEIKSIRIGSDVECIFVCLLSQRRRTYYMTR